MACLGQDDASERGTDLPGPHLVVIGNFDGVHLGHQAVLRSAAQEAQRRELQPLVLTFAPHPAEVLGRKSRAVLTRTARKVQLLRQVVPGLRVHVKRFDEALAALTPAEFAERILREELDAKAVVVGENFRFGKGRAGDLSTLERLGKQLGFEAWAESLTGDAEGPFSSTRIRQMLAAGDVRAAAALLGRPHLLTGTVSRGDERGRTLGFPTANLTEVRQALPAEGVYAVFVYDFSGSETKYLGPGVANLGGRPTVGRPATIEVHVLDFSEDLYERHLGVALVAHLRTIERFSNVEALVAQIGRDVERARHLTRDPPSELPFSD